MREIQRILSALNTVVPSEGALATVVRLDGSGFRRPGARMLVRSDGRIEGGVSAGCLEADVAEHCRLAIAEARPRLVSYQTDDDSVFGLGLGCDGHIRILVEPLASPNTKRHLAFLDSLARDRCEGVIATALKEGDDPIVGRWFLRADGEGGNDQPDDGLGRWVSREAEALLEATRQRRHPLHRVLAGPDGSWLTLEAVPSPVTLLICGIGADAAALADQAQRLGWCPWVLDHRRGRAASSHVPAAERVLEIDPAQLADHVKLGPNMAAVVMSHSIEADRAWLGALLPSPVGYLGVMGPRARTARLLSELPSGNASSLALHAPVGLDIGAEAPEELALAICAEIQAVLAGRDGGFLRDRQTPIHDAAVPLSP